ncbi:TetR/AcrR family transcriptional regulator [Streptomonospora nanhaiensis]|uniref:AcrR family transcriptional regulator n=1 Tax=Streptomonospora nanhaiensis TaxID=1323731 RepID=A0A853BSP5_9ACTN|nr:TetR/AcrR family transcriptional regulator C-terminal domain-containing protein [Streptomonospora nanhaiensis]MBV2362196.1 TetR/AcrR family transcriptional regulator C-terminal domain-containing protein [Streptomonospora nanhaiensis]MBX9388156.1 TetR/AcrR family transcriptional regulator C-terminal domain-containing protein [Streptomonospora nanhaiensis]NYI97352.1 AcrR family transcriptional regulator [Streptomonospora nanhaiensis]
MPQQTRRGAADRTTLNPRTVVEGALALADTHGLESVTIRRLATELGVTPMALYWHFRSKDELLDGMVDRIYDRVHERIAPRIDHTAPWPDQLRALLEAMVDVLRAHPATAPLLATRGTMSESGLRATEAVLGVLRRAGFSPSEATQVARHALSTVTDLVTRVRRTTAPAEETDEAAAARRRARAALEALPPDRYPHVIEAAGPLSACDDPDAHYAFGLDLLLAGIETTAARER